MTHKDEPDRPRICASCAAEFTGGDAVCPVCGEDPLLDGRYGLEKVVGHGAHGTTYRAVRISDGHTVAIKELLVRKVASLKAVELFEREARVLEQLEHDGVPRFFDELTVESGRNVALYLVQEFVQGETLAAEFARRRATVENVFEMAAELLDTLVYLHASSPPVIHRDIKPANVMRRADNGRLVLIDFGSVRDALDSNEGGSTVAGTFGYMAPEQFVGRAIPATDIYGVGAAVVALLAREDPQELIGPDRTIAWEGRIELPEAFAHILAEMLEPDPARRLSDAAEVARRIRAAARGDWSPPAPGPESGGNQPSVTRGPTLDDVPPKPRPVPGDFEETYAADASTGRALSSMLGVPAAFMLLVTATAVVVGAPNVLAMITGGLACLFAVFALRSRWKGWALSHRRRLSLREGRAVVGKITHFGDSPYSSGGKNAAVYAFRFEVDGRTYSAQHHSWEHVDLVTRDEVVILYRSADPAAAVIYDPRRYGAAHSVDGGPRIIAKASGDEVVLDLDESEEPVAEVEVIRA